MSPGVRTIYKGKHLLSKKNPSRSNLRGPSQSLTKINKMVKMIKSKKIKGGRGDFFSFFFHYRFSELLVIGVF